MMHSCYNRVENYHLVTTTFGEWPSFDDFEVVSILLERSHDGEELWPEFTIQFLGFCQKAVTEGPNRNSYLLTFRFGGVENPRLEGFNHQNALNGVNIKSKWSERLKQDMFDVELVQGFGVGAKFDCREIEVLSVEPGPFRNSDGLPDKQ